jgi:hypothetical protein
MCSHTDRHGGRRGGGVNLVERICFDGEQIGGLIGPQQWTVDVVSLDVPRLPGVQEGRCQALEAPGITRTLPTP